MIWEKTEVESGKVRSLCDKYGIDSLLSSILVRRGLTTSKDIKFFLEDDYRYLHNPFLFNDMEDVIDRLHVAVEEEEKVLVFGDKDVDGVTSSVLLYESLKILELDVSWQVPKGDDSYGLSVKVVDEAYAKDISLILTVDCGISAFESIAHAAELGIDVIIIDHHNPREGALPKATFIINPKLENSGYPFNGLAAVGVVSKVIWAICYSMIDTLYKSPLCFLHGEKTESGIIFTATKMLNLVPISEMTLEQPADFISYLSGQQILVYGESEQKQLFSEVFGTGTELHVVDIKPEIERVLRGISGRSFDELKSLSKMKLYSEKEFRGIDLLVNLFITYIERRYIESFEPFHNCLDLVALGTVADLMPLKDENRILVRKGLGVLSRTKRNGLQALLLKQNLLGKNISSKDIAWGIAPIINSAGRMKKADVAVNLLLGEDPELRNKNALDILALNKERRSISESLWSSLYNDLHKAFDDNKEKMVILYHDDMVKGVTGIIAARCLSTFNVPAIILAKEGDQLSASIRSTGDLDINLFFSGCKDILTEWGGHNCAAGFKLKKSDLNSLLSKVHKMINRGDIVKNVKKKIEKIVVDAFIPANYLSPEIIKTNDYFEPFGEGNPPLSFVTKSTKIIDINFMGKGEKKHLKLLFEIGEYKWPAIYWNSADRAGRDFTKGDTVDIAYRVERNFYGGSETLQLNILDIIK